MFSSPSRTEAKSDNKVKCHFCLNDLKNKIGTPHELREERNILTRYRESCHICKWTACPKHSCITCIECANQTVIKNK